MADLNLNFLNNPYSKNKITSMDILEKYGKEITEYAKDYFTHIVTNTSVQGEHRDASLYIVAKELGYEYRIINIEMVNISIVKVSLFSIAGLSPAIVNIDITHGLTELEKRVKEFLSSAMANESLRLLAYKVDLKRKSKEEMEN